MVWRKARRLAWLAIFGSKATASTSAVVHQSVAAFDGLVDDLRIYEQPLTQSDIQAISGAAVSVKSTDYIATEASGNNALFTIVRTGSTAAALTVNYSITNSGDTTTNGATMGTDYSSLSGTVTIPAGSSSVNVTVVPIQDAAVDASETVKLTLSPSANYLIGGSVSDQIVILDDEATGDIGWFSYGNKINSNTYGWSYNTNNAGGSTGEIGGTFAKNAVESYYGDTHLSQSFTLNDSIQASGKFTPQSVTNFDPGKFFVGHFSQAVDNNRREFIGMEITNDFGAVRARARIYRTDGDFGSDAASGDVTLTAGSDYQFDYTYDPDYENDASHVGPEGRLALHITGPSLDTTVYAINLGSHRDDGSIFDAFGMGMSTSESGSEVNSAKNLQFFMDDVIYSGLATINTVSVSATDASASEPTSDKGVYTFTRSNAGPQVVVNYSMSGTATNGTDYGNLNGTITIPSGSSSATLTLNPTDDSAAEVDETAILTITPSAELLCWNLR